MRAFWENEKKNKWRFFLFPSSQAEPERDGGDWSTDQRQPQVGRSSKHQHGGVVIHDLNLLHHQDKQDQWSQWRYPSPVVASRIPDFMMLIQPSVSGGSCVDPAWGNPISWRSKGTESQQEEVRDDGGAKGKGLGFFTFERKSKLFLFCHYCCFCDIYVSAWRGLEAESTSNKCFKKFPASICSRRLVPLHLKLHTFKCVELKERGRAGSNRLWQSSSERPTRFWRQNLVALSHHKAAFHEQAGCLMYYFGNFKHVSGQILAQKHSTHFAFGLVGLVYLVIVTLWHR